MFCQVCKIDKIISYPNVPQLKRAIYFTLQIHLVFSNNISSNQPTSPFWFLYMWGSQGKLTQTSSYNNNKINGSVFMGGEGSQR